MLWAASKADYLRAYKTVSEHKEMNCERCQRARWQKKLSESEWSGGRWGSVSVWRNRFARVVCLLKATALYMYALININTRTYVCGLYYMAYVRQLRVVYTHWLTTSTKLTWRKASVSKGDNVLQLVFRSRLSSHDICRLHGKFIEHVSRSAFFTEKEKEREHGENKNARTID